MKTQIYFISFRSSFSDPFFERFKKILKKVNFENDFKKNDFVGIKTHFGELGNVSYIQPAYIRFIAQYYKNHPVRLFVTDTNTIYAGSRSDAVNHLHNAFPNGFSYATLGIPVIIADGLLGLDYVEVAIDKEIFNKVKIAKVISELNKMIVVSHVKGHMVGGFGGALKNLGMGCAPRPQKYAMHSTMNPFVKQKKCIGCGKCIKWCPADAITIVDGKAFISNEKCTGCGECIEVCPETAIDMNWNSEAHRTQKAWVETAYAVTKKIKPENILYINFINHVTPDCDCFGFSDNPIVPDIGVLVGTDPIAIDKASIDLINDAEGSSNSRLKHNLKKGEDKFKALYPQINWKVQIEHGEKIGMGTQEYELMEVK